MATATSSVTAVDTTAKAPETTPVPCEVQQAEAAAKLLKSSIYWSIGASTLPIPALDILGVGGIQLKLLKDLAGVYKVEFKESLAKSILASLLSSIGTAALLTGSVASVVKMIPGLGSVAGGVALTAVAGASTYALGKIFTQHFAAGGTFLDFDPLATRRFFAEQFKEGKAVAESMQKSAPAAAAAAAR